jgi:hypothetical protein
VKTLRALLIGPAPETLRELERAVAAVDREIAVNLELSSLFDQTRQAVVLENAEFTRHGPTLEREVRATYAGLADLYARIPAAEAAMERRGPANSLREEDRALVEAWEGDARALQRMLRGALADQRRSGLARAIERLRGRPTSVR